YLPEYREVRARAGSFLELCYTPALAAEVSLQPLRRFELDAAILFSDILVIPDALGQEVRFETGEGPRLEPMTPEGLGKLRPETVLDRLNPVFETLQQVKTALPPDKTLIGFCGSPWTVATYMIAGQGSTDQAAARIFALTQPQAFARLLDILVEASVVYLVRQFEAGADVVQLFESWAMNLDPQQFRDYVIAPNRRIVEGVRARIPGAAFIGFPRGAAAMLPAYADAVRPDVLGIDFSTPPESVDADLPKLLPVQGNLDPIRLLAGGAQLDAAIDGILAAFGNRPHIFNLGHGILPQTPIENVERLVRRVKGG
ncbi:MAG TPA: uroporphyrinogen decarboxylase, partial [Devosia sp.]|nr:uroporphyrinogen decarboxylase [Devosia sp.]